MSKAMQAERKMWSKHYTYDEWMESQGVPIYRGYYIEDLRTLQLGWWDERQCNSAFIQLVGQEGVTSARVTEIPPGKTLPPLKFALDEIVYVVEGRGLTTIWAGEKRSKKTPDVYQRVINRISDRTDTFLGGSRCGTHYAGFD